MEDRKEFIKAVEGNKKEEVERFIKEGVNINFKVLQSMMRMQLLVNYSVIELPSFLLNRVTFSGMTVTMHPVVDRLSPVFHRFFVANV